MNEKYRWIGPYLTLDRSTERHADDVTLANLVKLKKDNFRYKEALEKIAQPVANGSTQQAYIMQIIATNALKGE